MRSSIIIVSAVLSTAQARADFEHPATGEIALRALAGAEGRGMEGHAIVDAPWQSVLHWMTDFEFWPVRFRDVKKTRVLSRSPTSARVWIDSHIMDEVAITARYTDDGITYEAVDDRVHATGRIVIRPTRDGRADVLIQTTAKLHGLLGVLIPRTMLRDRQREKLLSDLSDLNRLAAERRTAHRVSSPAPAGPTASSRQ